MHVIYIKKINVYSFFIKKKKQVCCCYEIHETHRKEYQKYKTIIYKYIIYFYNFISKSFNILNVVSSGLPNIDFCIVAAIRKFLIAPT